MQSINYFEQFYITTKTKFVFEYLQIFFTILQETYFFFIFRILSAFVNKCRDNSKASAIAGVLKVRNGYLQIS